MQNDVYFPEEPDEFYKVTQQRVNQYFAQQGKTKFATPFFYFKACLLILAYVSCYLGIFWMDTSGMQMLSFVCLGPLAILIGINVAHDAAHGTIAKKEWINKTFLHWFDLLGANSYMWKKRHVFSHHVYPNILNKDADLKQNPMVRIFPDDTLRKYHAWQFIYAPFLYLLYTINWLFFRDYQDFKAKEIGSLKIEKHAVSEYLKLAMFKLFYVSYIFILPAFFSDLSFLEIFLGFLGMNFAASILITLALIPSHVAEDSLFLLPDEKGIMPYSWSHHQVLSVIDFATSNVFLNFLFGGFNHHVAHHLFPSISHVHSVHVTKIIKQTAAEFGLKYNHEDSFLNAYVSHFKLLRNNGKPATN